MREISDKKVSIAISL